MRLVTFENQARQARIGAATEDGRILDLNSACALYLRDVEGEEAHDRLADALVPPNMRALFEGGDTSLEAARKARNFKVSDALRAELIAAGILVENTKDGIRWRRK